MASSARPTSVKDEHDDDDAQTGRQQVPPRAEGDRPGAEGVLQHRAPADVQGPPSPRNVNVVSDRIATATVSVVLARTSGMTLGSTCRVIWCQLPPPSTRARSRYGRPSDGQRLRADQPRRGGPRGDPDDDDDVEQRLPPGRSPARSPAAGTGSPGTSRSSARGTRRTSSCSGRRRCPPACRCTIEMIVAAMPTSSEIRVPHTSSARTDRPLSSVPSGYAWDGFCSTPPVALVTSRMSLEYSTGAEQRHRDEDDAGRTRPTTPGPADPGRRGRSRADRDARRAGATVIDPLPCAASRRLARSCADPRVDRGHDDVGDGVERPRR